MIFGEEETQDLAYEKFKELSQEFEAFYRDVTRDVPENQHLKDEAFRLWTIQKLARLQLTMLELVNKVYGT
jgi:hypothetical protein